MFPDVMEALTLQRLSREESRLRGYERRTVRGKIYPGIYEEPQAEVLGQLWFDVDTETMAILDYFEDEFYQRRTVQVFTVSRGDVEAEVYVVPLETRHVLSIDPWDENDFRRRLLPDYLPRCRQYRQRYLSNKSNR